MVRVSAWSLLVWFAACGGAVAADAPHAAITPTHANVAYGEHPRQMLDLYLVESDAPAPLAVFIHGGAFVKGDQTGVAPAAIRRLHERGIHVASIAYRYTIDAPYPAPMHDAARAVQFLRHHADDYAIDPTRIAAWGESAGGGIALWLALHDDLADPEADDAVSRRSTRLHGAAGILAQSTYDPFATNALFPGIHAETSRMYQLLFGRADAEAMRDPALRPAFADASPITHVSRDDPPVFLVYKGDDEAVPADAPLNVWVHHRRQGESLAVRLDAAGVAHGLQIGGRRAATRGVPAEGDYLDFLIHVLTETRESAAP